MTDCMWRDDPYADDILADLANQDPAAREKTRLAVEKARKQRDADRAAEDAYWDEQAERFEAQRNFIRDLVTHSHSHKGA